MIEKLKELKVNLEGDLYTDRTWRTLYATDASDFREMPLAVARPKSKSDIIHLINFAKKYKTSIIPRTAGTSLGGQVVGAGIVVDVSKYLTNILELNVAEKWIRVQPGIVLDELNKYLEPHGLIFAPETSTSTRCMIGGMVGNNSCGTHSLVYGTTRDHVLEIQAILADGNEVTFGSVSKDIYEAKTRLDSIEGKVYQFIKTNLSQPEVQEEIRSQFPKPEIRRRNSGYAIDELLESNMFTPEKPDFNFSKLLTGSAGTLAFMTEIKLNLVDLPPKIQGVVAVHLNSVEDAALATVEALSFKPFAIELLDDKLLECTKTNIEQQKNRFFVLGDPGAIIVVEFVADTKEEIVAIAAEMEKTLKAKNLGFHFPVVFGDDVKKIWTLRKAGLGLLANVPGDPDVKAVACIEDTAVSVYDQHEYIVEFKKILAKYQKDAVFYAHIGDGEMHLRPLLNLKKPEDRELYFKITDEVASLIKRFRGSLSGEHGDGRVRGMFLPKMIGEKNYKIICDLKKTFDPDNIFNPGKIVNTPPMNTFLRYESGQETRQFDTVFRFDANQGILRHAEMCNGSGDCRKSHLIGGTMCPSYMATRDEKDTTRARANTLREFLTRSDKVNKFDHKEIYDTMDLCLSCKGCKSECPSNVDVAKLKAEFLQHYYEANGIPFRTMMIAHVAKSHRLGALMPSVMNFFFNNKLTSTIIKGVIGFSQKRTIPNLYKYTLDSWAKRNLKKLNPPKDKVKGKVYLFNDEFTQYLDTEVGVKAIQLLTALGYEVAIPKHLESARTFLSKGLVREAQKIAKKNVNLLKDVISEKTPLLGIEPSAILTFRDEYTSLVDKSMEQAAKDLGKNCLMIDEFIAREIEVGNITKEYFTKEKRKIKLHGHCHQKALSSVVPSKKILSLPENYEVEVINSGCCGMAGSFGYEKEHYDVSMKVGELVLFPSVRSASPETIVAAPGTSCRHQIKDGTGREAKHTVEVLYEALVKN
ncbi:MAG TPA: FAD-linked oxidase C-terminal domain-containing protein [Cytophagales bacterium]|nr:FAD-linked oxidase C-terminal domain-containing protein [Cytophagales bacterium]